MSLRLIRAVAETERLDDFHLARLLILLASADARKRTSEGKVQAVEGITKLAKLDFFLRYPTYLERALTKLGINPEDAKVLPRERKSIETAMIRFRYGPWDWRYRRWLGLLHARGLVTLGLQGKTVMVGLTYDGRRVAGEIKASPVFSAVSERSDLIVRVLGKMGATKLKDFTYSVVPEITTMKWQEEITP